MINDIHMTDFSTSNSSLYGIQHQQIKEIPKIRVIVRKRPLNKKEQSKNEFDIIQMQNLRTVIVKELKSKIDLSKYIEEHSFKFDNVFDEAISNEQVNIIFFIFSYRFI